MNQNLKEQIFKIFLFKYFIPLTCLKKTTWCQISTLSTQKSTSFEPIEWRPPIFIRWIIAKFFSRVIFFNQGVGAGLFKKSQSTISKNGSIEIHYSIISNHNFLKIWKTDLKKNRKSTFFSSWEKYAEEDPGEPFRRRRNFVGQKRKYNIKKRRHITCIKDKREYT